MHLRKLNKFCYLLPQLGKMRANGLLYLSEGLLQTLKKDNSLKQLAEAASLPGVIEPVIGMPDLHQGFGLPIGGVVAVGGSEAVVSAGAVGMDINCGVRLLRTGIDADSVDKKLIRLLKNIMDKIPVGVGKSAKVFSPDKNMLQEILLHGTQAVINQGFGWKHDLQFIENGGSMAGADPEQLSPAAFYRGLEQLGTLGGGNHFIEFQKVEDVYEEQKASKFGFKAGELVVMIHTGSRGLGHQVCTDYSESFIFTAKKYGIELPTRGLAAAPIDSQEGRAYLGAMAAAANYAFANRQVITHQVRQEFEKMFGIAPLSLEIVYDVAHNLAQWEYHEGERVLVHRKGAIRALPPGHPDNPVNFRLTGHPVIIPGTMGSASYVLTAGIRAADTYYSLNHGAGRVLSRKQAQKEITYDTWQRSLAGVQVLGGEYKDLADEAPGAYKDIDAVLEVILGAKLATAVAKLTPIGVIKGKN